MTDRLAGLRALGLGVSPPQRQDSDARERVQALSAPAALAEARAEICRRDLSRFIRAGWEHIEPGEPYLHNWHIDAMSEALTALFKRQILRLILNIPPRCAKSSVGSVLFPPWTWLSDPAFRMISTAYERGLAVRDAIKSRRLMDTNWYESLNIRDPETREPLFRMRDQTVKSLRRLKDSEDYYENDRGGRRIAVGVDGGSTGKGGHMIITDDPQDPRRARSDAERIHTLSWWDQTMSTRLDNQKTGLKLIIMQRLHCFDLCGHELSKNIGYVHVKFPMEFDPRRRCVVSLGVDKETGVEKVWSDPRTGDRERLWEDRFDERACAGLKKDLGPYGWAGQEQQDPIPEGGSLFKLEWFKEFDRAPIFDMVALSIDCAFTDAKSSSYVVIQVWGFKGPNAYLLDNVREHLSFVAMEKMIYAVRAKYRRRRLAPNAILIENKANGPAIISRLVKKIPGIIPCEPRKMGGSKFARASSVSPFVSAGNVFVQKDAPWLADFFLEATNFPLYTSDDQVDAMSQALWWRFLSNVDVKNEQAKQQFLKWSGFGDADGSEPPGEDPDAPEDDYNSEEPDTGDEEED